MYCFYHEWKWKICQNVYPPRKQNKNRLYDPEKKNKEKLHGREKMLYSKHLAVTFKRNCDENDEGRFDDAFDICNLFTLCNFCHFNV